MSTIVDSTIGDLPQATTVNPVDLLVMEQAGQAKKVTGQTLVDYLSAAIADVIADLTDDAEMSAASAQAAANAAAQSAAEVQGAANQIQANSGAIDDLRTAQAETLAVLSGTDRRIDYLLKKNNGILYDTETLTGSGPVVDVPSGAMDFAELKIVGGMSRKGKNLCQYTTQSKANFFPIYGGGDTGDGSLLHAGTYVVSYTKSAQKSVFGYVETIPGNNRIVSQASGSFTFTLAESTKIRSWLYFPDATTEISDAQLELGSIATSYEPYSADLIDAKVDQINSVGRNILPPFYTGETTINGIDVNPHSDGSVSIKGTASARAVIRLAINEQGLSLSTGTYTISLGVTLPAGVLYSAGLYNGANYIRNLAFPSFTIMEQEKSYHYAAFLDVSSGTTVDITYYPQLEKGTTSTPYTPYLKETVTIPASVQALDGYGIGISADCYNYVDFENKKFVKQVASRAYQSGDDTNNAFLTDGTTTYYPLENQTETDISDLLADFDDIIQIQAGGTINVHYPKLDNGYFVDVPTKTEIMVDVEEALQ